MVAILVPSVARGQAKLCEGAAPVTSPCAGLLIPFQDAQDCLRAKMEIESSRQFCALEQQLLRAELAEVGQLLEAEQRRANALSRSLDKQLAPEPFYKTFWFGAFVGAVVVGLGTWAVLEAK